MKYYQLSQTDELLIFFVLVAIAAMLVGCSSTGMMQKAAVNKQILQHEEAVKYSSTEVLVKRPGINNHKITMQAVAFRQQDKKWPADIMLHFISSSEGWKFLDYRAVSFIVDGSHWKYTKPERSHDAYYGEVMEQIIIDLSFDRLKKLAEAKEVKAKVGIYEINLSHERRKALRLLVNELEG